LIEQQRQRSEQYNQLLQAQEQLAQQRAVALQQQRRLAQYAFQQQYLDRLRQQQRQVANWRSYDYNNDPYFYTAPSYSYYRGGTSYQTNQYGADLLQQAVNYGYEEGFRAGQADRQDRAPFNYRDSYAYRDANYGYNGLYVSQADYNYYFREGFRRGYEDGYYSRSRYGTNVNGKLGILSSVLSTVLRLTQLR
jgi:hypothetical protein